MGAARCACGRSRKALRAFLTGAMRLVWRLEKRDARFASGVRDARTRVVILCVRHHLHMEIGRDVAPVTTTKASAGRIKWRILKIYCPQNMLIGVNALSVS